MRVTRFFSLLSAIVVVGTVVVGNVACDGSNGSDGGDAPDAGLPPPIFVDAGPIPEPVDGGDVDVDAGPINSSVYITGLSEASGPQAGGNRVTIQGDGFDPSCSVRYGDVEAEPELCILLTQRAFACQVPPGVEPGPVDVTIVCANGIGQLEDGYTYFSPIALASIAPATGDVEGGTPITLTGESFTAGMVALIGQRHVVALDVADDGRTATALTPPGLNAARVDVVVIDTFGRATLPRAFAYTSALRLDSVDPAVASPGDVIDVFGAGFTESNGAVVSAAVDDVAADRDNLVSDRRQRVVVPAVAAGPQDVSVDRVVDADTVDARLGDALVVLGAATGTFTVSAVVPRFVDLGGGDVVTIAGEGFTTASAVTVDGAAATDVVVVDDRRLRARVPAHAAGAATVVVTRADASTASLPNALTYRQQLRVVDVEPASGAAEGGLAVTVNGAGFVAGATVRFGGVPCADVVVVDSSTITCTTAAGAPGLVDVRVTNADGTSVVAGDAFLFETPVNVVGIVPARGAFSGDVVVSVAGAGFERLQRLATTTNPLLVLIGGIPCDPRELVVVSDNLLTTRTPLTDIGTYDVTVGLATVALGDNGQPVITMSEDETSTKARAYTTYDPTSMLGGTRGGPIEGALYVTALDAFTGAPIPNALAFTGTDGHPTAADITHVFGQATLSGPDIFGAQTVTVAADGYETGTLVDVNARDVTFLLQPTGGGTPSPPNPNPQPAPLPAQVRGRVFGFAKEFFDPAALSADEIALAIVVTSARDEFSSSGNGGTGSNNNVFTEGGEFYLANTRTGRLALVAVAGIYNLVTGEFRPRQLGIRNEVFPQRGVTLIDQDIELNIPLDETVAVSLPDAPLDFDITDYAAINGNGPDITRVVPYLQLNGEGAFNYTVAIDGTRNHAIENMPDVPGAMLTFIAGAYSTTGRNLYTQTGTANLTRNSIVVGGNNTQAVWGALDFQGLPNVIGMIFVAELPDGTRFGSDILGVASDGSLHLRDRAPVTASAVRYHIGNAGNPSSQVIQDGVGGVLRGGVTIQPVLGIPEIVTPSLGGALERRTIRWRAQPGEQPTIHRLYVYEALQFAQLWSFVIEGSRTKVPVPVVPEVANFIDVLPIAERELPETFVPPQDLLTGAFFLQHEAIYTPNLDYASWSELDLSLRGRRAWTTNTSQFIHGDDD